MQSAQVIERARSMEMLIERTLMSASILCPCCMHSSASLLFSRRQTFFCIARSIRPPLDSSPAASCIPLALNAQRRKPINPPETRPPDPPPRSRNLQVGRSLPEASRRETHQPQRTSKASRSTAKASAESVVCLGACGKRLLFFDWSPPTHSLLSRRLDRIRTSAR